MGKWYRSCRAVQMGGLVVVRGENLLRCLPCCFFHRFYEGSRTAIHARERPHRSGGSIWLVNDAAVQATPPVMLSLFQARLSISTLPFCPLHLFIDSFSFARRRCTPHFFFFLLPCVEEGVVIPQTYLTGSNSFCKQRNAKEKRK